MLTVQELYDNLAIVIARGDGDAVVYVCDTRSGIDEECSAYKTVERDTLLSDDTLLDKAYPIYLG